MTKLINGLIVISMTFVYGCYSEQQNPPSDEHNNSVMSNVDTTEDDISEASEKEDGECFVDNYYINNCFISQTICHKEIIKTTVECSSDKEFRIWETLPDPPPQIKQL